MFYFVLSPKSYSCGLERCKSLDEEFDCSWQNLSHNFQLGRANINFNVFPKHVRVEGQDARTIFCDPLSQSDLYQMWEKTG